MNEPPIHFTTVTTPLGTMVIGAERERIVSIRLMTSDGRFGPPDDWRRDDGALRDATDQIQSYFTGNLTDFNLPLGLRGTPFQIQAWTALLRVPYGETVTYAELAAEIGAPRASRAVGLAMQRNPITLVVPCHRVIGSDGRLRGYLNGLETKRRLIEFEQTRIGRSLYAAMP